MTSMVAASASERPDAKKSDVGGQVMVTFFTTTFAKTMPEQSFLVPLPTLPEGLSKLVESVLEVDGQRFDFLYKDEYITTSLEKFLNRRGISHEELLNIEYTPALQAEDGALLPHDDWVSAVRAPLLGSADFLVTGSYDHCVRVWDGETCVALGPYHTACVKELCVHPISPISTTSTQGAGAKRRERSTARAAFDCVSCGGDGRIVAWRFDPTATGTTGTATGTTGTATGTTGTGTVGETALRPIGALQAHAESVESVDVSPSRGEFVATASWDKTVKVFEWARLAGTKGTEAAAPLLCFDGQARAVLSCRFSAARGAARLFAAGLDGTVEAFDIEHSAVSAQFLAQGHAIRCLAVRPSSGPNSAEDFVLTAATDGRVRLFDTREKGVVRTFSGHRQWAYAVTWLWRRDEEERNGNGNGGDFGFATAGEDSTVRVWDLRSTAAPLLTLDAMHTDGVLDVTYAGAGQIVSCGKDNKTRSFTIVREHST